MIHIETEKMRDGFEKFHLKGLPFDMVLHKISQPDINGLIHDHPWGFTTHILYGGYIERVYIPVHGQDKYKHEDIYRVAGEVVYVRAEHIHEIVELPEGECWTAVIPHLEDGTREWGFWEFRKDGNYFRQWNKEEFKKITNA